MSQFSTLLGPKLLKGKDSVSTEEALKGKTVGLYFSAHWCGPCRQFTPNLIKFYNDHHKEKNFEIVFVSADQNDSAFNNYYGTMPWLAVNFDDDDVKMQLNNKYKVQGIPTFVLIDENGKTITTEARMKIMEDIAENQNAKNFPYTPKTFNQIMNGLSFINNKGESVTFDSLKSKKALGVYFSAHWCPPCRGFTPVLAETYKKIPKNDFEIVFVSSDKDEKAFKEYHSEMPWLALPFSNRDSKKDLAELYKVEGIPSFVIVDPSTGKIINDDGRTAVMADQNATQFPWHPKALSPLGGPKLNEAPCLLLMLSPNGAKNAEIKKQMSDLAENYAKQWDNLDEKPLYFFCSEGEQIEQKVRQLLGLGDSSPMFLVINIPEQAKYTPEKGSDATDIQVIKTFVDNFVAGKVKPEQLGE